MQNKNTEKSNKNAMNVDIRKFFNFLYYFVVGFLFATHNNSNNI